MTALSGAPTASGAVAGWLRGRILDGSLRPGERIRQEEVADRLGASRIPVREALHMLHAEGLVDLKSNSGAWVATMDLHECDSVYRIRERIETLALAESVPHLTDADIDEMADVQDQIERADGGVETFLTLDREFHRIGYRGCRVAQLTQMVDRLWNSTQHYRRAFTAIDNPGRAAIVNAEHRLILDAVTRRDTVDCERYLGGHIRRTRTELSIRPELFDQ
jgi:DNA-binding GntR family transcriptional regulator